MGSKNALETASKRSGCKEINTVKKGIQKKPQKRLFLLQGELLLRT